MKKINKQMTIDDLKKEKQVHKQKTPNYSNQKRNKPYVMEPEKKSFFKGIIGKWVVYVLIVLVVVVLSIIVNQNHTDGFFVMIGIIIFIYAFVSIVIFLRK